jgi:serine-type D-Ala-D-Ala carboxypeptidase/endopeptidase (penicillin-binding protein 4)
VAQKLRGSTARHVNYDIELFSGPPGTGAIADGHISRGAHYPSAPASNEKLFVSIAALQSLPGGARFRYTTVVSGTRPIDPSGVLSGDLVLVGSGDPTLTASDLRTLAHHLYAHGLRRVTGRLIVDDSRYSQATRAVGWKKSFVPGESGTVDAFSVDGNQGRHGPSFERDPTPANAALWRRVLDHAHIRVTGKTTIGPAPAVLTRLVSHQSVDLATLLASTLTYSINFNMEMILRELGAQRTGYGTIASGLAAVRADATLLGVPFGTAHDGSGLSYADRETPATITAWLTRLTTQPYYLTEYAALPRSCQTGTLAHRLCGTHVRGEVRAKTGTLDHNTALSGFITTASGHFAVFSFLVSGFEDSHLGTVEARVDAAVSAIARR